MNRSEPNASLRIVGPLPFYDNDGQKLVGLDFKTALGHVFTSADGTDWVAAAADVTTNANSYSYPFSQAEVNKNAYVAVKLSRPGTTGNTTSTAANTATNTGAGMIANQYKGQWFVDVAGARYLISSHTTTAFTLAASGATPAAGAYTVESYRDVEYSEKVSAISSRSYTADGLAALGIQIFGGQSAGTFSRTAFTLATADAPSTLDDFYNGALVEVVEDTVAANVGAFAVVDDYVGATKILTLAGTGLPIVPTANTRIAITKGADCPPSDFVREFFDGNAKLEGTWTPGDVIRLIASIAGGKVSDFRSGTLVFRDLLDTKDRWTVVTDPSGRITITPGNLT